MRRTISSLSSASVIFLASVVSGDADAAVGGPDPFGYRYADQASGAVYAYVDITPTGALLVSGDDVVAAATDLGAPFVFYGETLDTLTASTNGFLRSTGVSAEFSNSCPQALGAVGGHIAALHDDLDTDVYYEYFDQAEAAAIGYPGQVAGISVFQWDGVYFNDDSPVDAEVILFHDDGRILSMVAEGAQNGSSSTTGIQNVAATSSLTYSCNTVGGITPGVTAVEYSPPPVVSINEIRIDQPGANDPDEYIELVGPPGASLDGLSYVVLGDPGTGFVEYVLSLNGGVIGPSGFFVIAEGTFTLGVADLTSALTFENADTTTHMLLRTFSGSLGNQLDADADGVLDSTPWFSVGDALAIVDLGSAELPYGPGASCVGSPYCNQLTIAGDPEHVFRCGDGDGTWNEGAVDIAAVPPTDSPGEANPCACGDGILILGETCDDAGESVDCDSDCTVPSCGDGLTNQTFGEDCDGAGESVDCNEDCTTAVCGDSQINVTAGEVCDDGGESDTCDNDCTLPVCGDGLTNMTAGETCDDSGASATCDDDCTAAACGDLVVNAIAGETCDDGGRSGTCNANCTVASCGDGVLNMTAGEECDGDGEGGGGETEDCDADCTNAMCGDAVVNEAAGEDCDDGKASAECDDDCTAATCGDGTLNAAAGEDCDDGNTDAGDGCAADCTIEDEPGTTGGGSSDTGMGESTDSGGTDATTGGADTTEGGTVADESGGGSGSAEGSTGGDSDSDSADSSGSGGGASPDDSGCSCSTTTQPGAASSLLALFGLGALRRRRRQS